MKRLRGVKERRPIYGGAAGVVARAVDAVVGTFAPATAHAMRVARIKSEALIAHEAARLGPQNPRPESGSADAEILPDLQKLRDLSRSLIRDDPHAAATINIHEECIVGEGIRPQGACMPAETGLTEAACAEWNDQCRTAWDRWAEDEADATEVGTFYDLQALALRCYLQDGDAIGHAVVGGDATIRCELVDADRVDSPNGFDTETIRGGVELGPHGERVAFWILPNHPDDAFFGGRLSMKPVRVPVDDNGVRIVQHVFKRTRAGQTRGVPLLTAALLYTKNLHHYLDSELIAARASSNFALFIKRGVSRNDPDIRPVQDDDDGGAGPRYLEELSPGIIEYLNEGEEPFAFNPNRPGSNFDPFVTRVLRATASSSGLAYEVVCRDFARMNLSSARALLREIKRGFDLMRRRLVRGFCDPWWSNVIRMEVGSGRLRAPAGFRENPEAFLRATWVAPVFGFVDPESDTKGSTLEVEANLSDPFTEAQKRGRDFLDILDKTARAHVAIRDREAADGLPPGSLRPRPAGSVAPPGPPPAQPGQEPTGTRPANEDAAPAELDEADDGAEGDDEQETPELDEARL